MNKQTQNLSLDSPRLSLLSGLVSVFNLSCIRLAAHQLKAKATEFSMFNMDTDRPSTPVNYIILSYKGLHFGSNRVKSLDRKGLPRLIIRIESYWCVQGTKWKSVKRSLLTLQCHRGVWSSVLQRFTFLQAIRQSKFVTYWIISAPANEIKNVYRSG